MYTVDANNITVVDCSHTSQIERRRRYVYNFSISTYENRSLLMYFSKYTNNVCFFVGPTLR